ncbi:MAG: type 1 glutamine amidotransferase [Calditrichaeota bacterium]|nr:MAG: type 1 glutamine amidotransferase [Calditrichota bacterium]
MKPILIIQNCKIESPGTITDYLTENGLPYQIIHTYNNHDFPAVESISSVINLGCPESASTYEQVPYLKNLYAFVARIVRTNKPYLGICFGAQILARVLGAQVIKNEKMEIGTYKVTLTDEGKSDSIFEGINSPFNVFHWHADTFKIPFGAELLATGVDCKNQAFRQNNLIGIQFHFEADIKEIPTWCDAYTDELKLIGKTKEQVISEYESHFESIKSNNSKFIGNFLKVTKVG